MTTLSYETSDHHLFLASGTNPTQARQQAIHFLHTTQLVIYQSTTIIDSGILSGANEHFWGIIETGIAANRAFCRSMLTELQETGVTGLEDLLTMQTGYPSKVLHILTHMLDGFIGIDSVFYNLVEESHWLSETLRATIHQNPKSYWLVPVHHGPVAKALLLRENKGIDQQNKHPQEVG